MSYIKGKYKTSIFESTSGYKVGLFKVQETDDKEIEENNRSRSSKLRVIKRIK